ncbi:MAG: hypothetical protein AAB574_01895 [Patescibacteria group bacterium]
MSIEEKPKQTPTLTKASTRLAAGINEIFKAYENSLPKSSTPKPGKVSDVTEQQSAQISKP